MKNYPILGLSVAAVIVAALAGCEGSSGSNGPAGPARAPDPAHPAMLSTPSGAAGTRATAPPLPPNAGGVLPDGHPDISGGAPGTPGAPVASSGPTAPAGPELTGAAARIVEIGPMRFQAPAEWVRKAASSQFLIAEFSLPHAEGDAEEGRFTVSSAGGSTDDNIRRWQGQFKDGPPAKTERIEVQGLPVAVVHLSGTMAGGGGPMAKSAADKPNFKMWGAVIELPATKIFLKGTGPAKTADKWDASFLEFLKSLKK